MPSSQLKKLESGKLYYSISEVCALTGLEQHVLRYWESEFSQLRPKKNRAGNRAYREKEIKIIRFIKHLLHEEMFTIQGARKKMAEASHFDYVGQTDLLKSAPVLMGNSNSGHMDGTQLDLLSQNPVSNASSPSLGPSAKPGGELIRELKNDLRDILRILGR